MNNIEIQSELNSRELFSKILYDGDPTTPFELYGNRQSTVLYKGIPYAQYYQLRDQNAYIFHPLVFARYIHRNASVIARDSGYATTMDSLAYELPNAQGKAFYYPGYYPLNRMSGPEIVYSAISQGEMLAGCMQLAKYNPFYKEYVDATIGSLLYDYHEGGVSLSSKALLEIPLFRSAPEIILNGWLHALIHLNDYYRLFRDERIAFLLKSNLGFLLERQEDWYDERLKISKYSNLSPYRAFFVAEALDEVDSLHIQYYSKSKGIKDQEVFIDFNAEETFGIYDNHFVKTTDTEGVLFFNCSSLYNTRIVASIPFLIHFRAGKYDTHNATPNKYGEKLTLMAHYDSGLDAFVADLKTVQDKLFLGYPCNFSKSSGKNVYHVQHIVSLLLLGHYCPVLSSSEQQELLDIGRRWYLNTPYFPYVGVDGFESPQTLLNEINETKVIKDQSAFDELLRMSKIPKIW